VTRTDGYVPIRDYALIGDGRTCALVAKDGAVDWLCLPNVDSPSVFARLLDAERGGSFQLGPVEPFEVERRYQRHSNVLETTFRTASGAVRVTDALTLTGRRISPLRELVRKVDGLAGGVELRWRVDPRFDYGRQPARFVRRDGHLVAAYGRDALAFGLFGAGEPDVEGSVAVRDGDSLLFTLAHAHQQPLVLDPRALAERRLEYTAAFWPRWADRAEYEGEWKEEVLRAALVLKLLVFSPSGAIVAAPTTSLPEELGGGRNWDYRFSWLRDSTWTLDALLRLGYDDEAQAFFWWLMHASRRTQPRLQVLYQVNGSAEADEKELDLAGYRDSAPVRIGNGAAEQVQLDVYGSLLEAIWLHVRHGKTIDGDTGKEIAKIADYVCRIWRQPDSGIWEVRSGPFQFVQSKAMCWVALDRAAKLAERGRIPDRRERWLAVRDEIRRFVEEEGWDEELRSYVRATDLREPDAGLLTLGLQGYDEAAGEGRILATAAAVQRELSEGPLVRRYRGDDGVEGGQGAFLICSFWLANVLGRCGREEEAHALMEELCAQANDVGLYAEAMDPATGEFLGNFPQGLTHLGLVNAACALTGQGGPE
jgi:GH15 family glucan-1,4-alpha-glucosidase